MKHLLYKGVANDIVVCHSDGCQNPSWFSLKENGQRNILVISHWLLVVSKNTND